MVSGVVNVVVVVAALLVQVIDLLCRPLDYFENHAHKLVWFLVLCIGNIIAAVWYCFWKHDADKAYKAGTVEAMRERLNRN